LPFIRAFSPPPTRITPSRLQLLKRHGHNSVVNGQELVAHLDPLTGATVLTSFELVTD
jgi:hypothetical protein